MLRQSGDNPHGFHADAHHLADEADDVFGIVGAVGIGANAAALVLADLILIDHPLQGDAVAQTIGKTSPTECRPESKTN